MILCASEIRLGLGGGDVHALVRLAADAGFDGIAAGARLVVGDLPGLVAAAAGAGLTVPAVAAPLGPAVPGPGRRLPHLAAADAEERAAAAALAEATWEAAAPLGARLSVLDFGAVALGTARAAVARAFERRELDEDEPGHKLLAAALAERRARSPAILDACRYGLDRLLRAADRHGIVLALELAADPWGAPSPREAASLVDGYRGAPLGVMWDPARLDALAALGTAPPPARQQALAAAARLRRAAEAVGIDPGYLPGQGDPAGAVADDVKLPAGLDVVVTGRADSTAAEVTRAREAAAIATRAAT